MLAHKSCICYLALEVPPLLDGTNESPPFCGRTVVAPAIALEDCWSVLMYLTSSFNPDGHGEWIVSTLPPFLIEYPQEWTMRGTY